jgi:hypothetical protein
MVALRVDMAKVSNNASHKVLAMAKIMIEMQTKIAAKAITKHLGIFKT